MALTSKYVVCVAILLVSCTGRSVPGRTSLYAEPDDYVSDDMYEREEDPRITELEERVEELQGKLDNISSLVDDARMNIEDFRMNVGYLDDVEMALDDIEHECSY